jgi:hypothetical protein
VRLTRLCSVLLGVVNGALVPQKKILVRISESRAEAEWQWAELLRRLATSPEQPIRQVMLMGPTAPPEERALLSSADGLQGFFDTHGAFKPRFFVALPLS